MGNKKRYNFLKISSPIGEKIKLLYSDGFSSNQISRLLSERDFSISGGAILKFLHREKIRIKNNKEAIISYHRKKEPVNKIIKLYKDNISIREISRRFHIGRETIRKILQENKLDIRNSRNSLIAAGYIKENKKFNLDSKEKAYLFGLVMGDLTPVKRSNHNLRIVTNTTHLTFIELLKDTFRKYGLTNYWLNKDNMNFQFQASLDFESFSFLMDKKKGMIPHWVNNDNFMDFLAGYIDSDGSIITRKSGIYFQYVVRFFGENKILLEEIKRRLENKNYDLSMHKSHKKGEYRYHNNTKFQYNEDYYILETFKKEQTIDLLKKIPIRHPEKIAKRELSFQIYDQAIIHWDLIEKRVKSLKQAIQVSVKSKTLLNWKIN